MEIIYRDLNSLLLSRNVDINNLGYKHKEVLHVVQELEGCWIAGGSVLALYMGKFNEIRDWDLFFDSDLSRLSAQQEFISLGYEESYKSDWSITLNKDNIIVQLITVKNYNSVDEIFLGFDISVCCFAIEYDHIAYTCQAQEDVENMVMNFITTETPIVCIKRIAKYGAKGFKPSTQFALDFINRVKRMKNIRANEGNISIEGIASRSSGGS